MSEEIFTTGSGNVFVDLGFSVERIASYLLRLNYDISLAAHPAPAERSGRVILAKQNRSIA